MRQDQENKQVDTGPRQPTGSFKTRRTDKYIYIYIYIYIYRTTKSNGLYRIMRTIRISKDHCTDDEDLKDL
jgi:hypothetical protein